MKVGDLVRLSSYGRARGYNKAHAPDQVGLIIEVNPRATYLYIVRWPQVGPFGRDKHCRKELAYVSKNR